jgi:hypothetical protein
MDGGQKCANVWWVNLRERDHWGDPGVDGSIILNGWRPEKCAVFWWGNLTERDHWGDPDIDGRIILEWI